MKEIVLAGGCFWGVEAYFKLIKGVTNTVVGYANGSTLDPTYKEVCTGTTNHAEVCKVTYNDEVIDIGRILKYFFRIIDPTLLNRQGGDIGTQYRTGVYYTDESEAVIIDEYFESIASKYPSPIVTEILPLESFYRAEEYHQDYLTKNPDGYCHIDINSALTD